jgi:probable rRNA maturation factor
MPIRVAVADEQDDQPVDCIRLEELARRVLEDRGLPERAELSVILVGEGEIAGLNARFLGREGPTDVLSFPIEDAPGGPYEPVGSGPPDRDGPPSTNGVSAEEAGPPLLLGDVVICPAVAHRNAPEHAGTYEDEMSLLLVHGILHVLGMDHESDDEADAMESLEADLLQRLGESGPHRRRR